MAVSLGLLDAFSIIVIARIAPDGAGDRKAWMRASSEARVRAWVNLIGRRSLMVRLARIVGSCSYMRSIFVRFGSSRGIKGGMLLSKRF
jgi:hypothetical protein